MPAYANDRGKYCSKTNIDASDTATVSAEKRTVRPAVRSVVATAAWGPAPAAGSSRWRRTMNRA